MKLLTSLIIFSTSLVSLKLSANIQDIIAVAQIQKTALLSAEDYVEQGKIYQKQEKHDLALIQYNKAIQVNPYSSTAYYNRGLLYALQEKYELSLADFNKVIHINPDYAGAYGNRGNAYLYLGKEKLALRDYDKAIKLEHNLARGYFNRGYVYSLQGKRKSAIADFQKARDLFVKKGDKINAKKANDHIKSFPAINVLKRNIRIFFLRIKSLIDIIV